MAESAKKCWQFVIAGIRLRITSEKPMTACGAWKKFTSSFDSPDLTFHIDYADRLPLSEENYAVRTERTAVSADGRVRIYFNPGAGDLTGLESKKDG